VRETKVRGTKVRGKVRGDLMIDNGVEVLLYSPKDFRNVCVIARTLEVFGIHRCYVYDPNDLIRPSYGKRYSRKLRKISSGAFFLVDFIKVDDPLEFIGRYKKRTIATVLGNKKQVFLDKFRFVKSDLLIFGSEATGIPDDLVKICDKRLLIRQFGKTQSLNLGMAVGIVLYEAVKQIKS